MARNILEHIPGEKRYYAMEFSAKPEIVAGESLTGTPTAVFDVATGLTVTLVTISGTQVRFWVESAANAAIGDRRVTVTCPSSGGATLKDVGTLRIVTQ